MMLKIFNKTIDLIHNGITHNFIYNKIFQIINIQRNLNILFIINIGFISNYKLLILKNKF